MLRTQGDVVGWGWLWVKWSCKMKYQCLTRSTRILANEIAQQEVLEDLQSFLNYVVMYFVIWLNGLFASPNCAQTWEHEAIRKNGQGW